MGREGIKQIYKPASHVAFWLKHGVWPEYVEHTCDNGICCNWDHLVDSDHQTNMDSMIERGRQNNQRKTYCSQNHSFAEHGVVRTKKDGRQRRVCLICARKASKEFRVRQKSG